MTGSVLVTGGAGFIGSHLVEALVGRGDCVRVLDDLSSGRLENLEACSGDVEVLVGDVRDAAAVERAMTGVDAVFHEAAIVSVVRSFDEPELVDGVNVGGSVVVLAAARRLGVERVVLASSAAVYGDTTELPVREDAPTRPLSPYGVGKLAVEGYAHCLAGPGGLLGHDEDGERQTRVGSRGLSVVCLRYFNVYGPRQDPSSEYSGVIARFIACAAAGEPYTIYGDGAQTRDFVYVGDVVRANLLALEVALGPSGAAARASINIGSGHETSVLHLAETVERVAAEDPGDVRTAGSAGAASAGESWPGRVRHEQARSGEVHDSCADITVARSALQYEPGWSLADGLRATWQSLRG